MNIGDIDELSLPPLSDQDVQEYRRIIQEESGRELSEGEARSEAGNLVRLFHLLAHPSPEPNPKPSLTAAEPAPADSAEPALLRDLVQLKEALEQTRTHRHSWRWVCAAEYQLLQGLLLAIIQAARAPAEARGSAFVPCQGEPLPRLLGRVVREAGRQQPAGAVDTLQRIERLHRQMPLVTDGIWPLLVDQFLDLIHRSLDLVAELGWGPEVDPPLMFPYWQKIAQRHTAAVEEEILLLRADQLKRSSYTG